MTIAIITDTHTGARSSSSIFRSYMQFWYDTEFFSKLKTQGVKTILHLGDFFDNRNSISVLDIDFVVNWFAPQIIDGGFEFIVILGNHDVAFKNTNKIHSLAVLKAAAPNNVTIIEECTSKDIDGQLYALVPWINSENYDNTMDFLATHPDKDSTIVAGHFEIAGAKHYASSAPAEHGLNAELFKEFQEVWSGHFHHKSKLSNVRYMGSAFHLNWQDYGDARGHHLFDAATQTLTFVENTTCLFTMVTFEADVFKVMTDAEYLDLFEGMFVRLVVNSEYNRVDLMDTVSKINRAKPHDLQVVNTYALTEDSTAESAEDVEARTSKTTQQYIEDYITDNPQYSDKAVRELMSKLFVEASTILLKGE